MITRLSRLFAIAFGLSLLASCGGVNPPVKRLPEMSFRHLAPIQLNVGRIEVVTEFQTDGQPPHIEYDMPISPENAIKRWVQDRLQPMGRTGTLRIVIRNAATVEEPLKTDTGFTGVFKKEQGARLTTSIDVVMQMLDDRQFTVAEVTGRAERSRTTPEGQKLNERDQVLYDIVEETMKGFNNDIEPNIRSTFGPWLSY